MIAANLPDLIVFDLAGTTVRDEGQVPAAFTEALESQGIALTPDQLLDVRGSSKKSAIQSLVPERPRSRPSRRRGLHVLPEQSVPPAWRWGSLIGARRRGPFSWLRARGVRIALNTGFDRVITELLLRALGWMSGVADAVVCAEDVRHGRPAPDSARRVRTFLTMSRSCPRFL